MVNYEHKRVAHPHYYNTLIYGSRLFLRHARGGLVQTGNENLEIEGGIVLGIEHKHIFDIQTVAVAVYNAIGAQVHFMAKKELFKRKLVAKALSAGGAFPIDRSKKSLESETINHMTEVGEAGGIIGTFPTGTRMKDDNLEEDDIKGATIIIARKLNLPIVPVAHVGTAEHQEGGIGLAFGKPVPTGKQVDGMPQSLADIRHNLYESIVEAHAVAQELQLSELARMQN